jgi:serine/threonine-protein kinase
MPPSSRRHRVWALALIASSAALCSVVSRRAHAAPPPSESDQRAEELFQDAKKLMAAGNYAEACPKLVEARHLAPGGGTLLALALCREGEGRGATALGLFREALAAATQANRIDRIDIASEHIRTLEEHVSRVIVTAAQPDRAGLVVTLDGAPLERARFGEGVAVDAGAHVIVAHAEGARAWSTTVSVAATGDVRRVEVPVLQVEALPAAVVAPRDPGRTDGRFQRSTGLVVAGVGLVAIGVGSFYGLRALSRAHDYQAQCPGNECVELASLALHDEAKRAATTSTIFFAVGTALAAGGVVLWLTAPRGEGVRAQIAPVITASGFGATLSARF